MITKKDLIREIKRQNTKHKGRFNFLGFVENQDLSNDVENYFKSDIVKCSNCGKKMKLDSVVTGDWAGGEYEEEYWKCLKCGRVIRISPFGDVVIREGERIRI